MPGPESIRISLEIAHMIACTSELIQYSNEFLAMIVLPELEDDVYYHMEQCLDHVNNLIIPVFDDLKTVDHIQSSYISIYNLYRHVETLSRQVPLFAVDFERMMITILNQTLSFSCKCLKDVVTCFRKGSSPFSYEYILECGVQTICDDGPNKQDSTPRKATTKEPTHTHINTYTGAVVAKMCRYFSIDNAGYMRGFIF